MYFYPCIYWYSYATIVMKQYLISFYANLLQNIRLFLIFFFHIHFVLSCSQCHYEKRIEMNSIIFITLLIFKTVCVFCLQLYIIIFFQTVTSYGKIADICNIKNCTGLYYHTNIIGMSFQTIIDIIIGVWRAYRDVITAIKYLIQINIIKINMILYASRIYVCPHPS